MFWDVNFNSESIDSLLNKEDVTLKELLDDEDILQDYKYQNKNLTQFLHRTEIIDELVTLITTEPPTDVDESLRFKHSNIACEILTSEVPALIERLVGSRPILEKLYAFLEQEPPLNPLLTSFCSKTFGMLLSKKPDQDWFSYQCVCIQMIEFIKSRPGFLNTIYKHIGTPVIVDLLFQIITTVEGEELRNSLFHWLRKQELMENLIRMLGTETDADKHNNIAQFISEVINTSRTIRQSDLQKHGYLDSSIDVIDPLMDNLEDEHTADLLLDLILVTNKKESSIVSGISILLKLLENPIVNEPVSDTALQLLIDGEKEHHQKLIGNIVLSIQPRIDELHALLLEPPSKPDIKTTVTILSPPFGSTRLYICTLFTVLIETGNPDIIESICETEFFNTMLKLFKQYCWNNILHNQVKRCFGYAFNAFKQVGGKSTLPSALQKHVISDCKVASKLIDCWKHNETIQSEENGRRLGYMGHLIDMLEILNSLVSVSQEFRALVESSLKQEQLNEWKILTEPTDGKLALALNSQKSFLAGIDPNQSYQIESSLSKDFQDDNYTTDYYNDIESNLQNTVEDFSGEELFEATCSNRNQNSFDNDFDSDDAWSSNDIKLGFPRCFLDKASDSRLNLEYQNSNTNVIINDADWADFDSYFSNFEISDNKAFPVLEQKVNLLNINSNNVTMNHDNLIDPFGPKKTFAEVAAAWDHNPSDNNANDIKKWPSAVINTENDINPIENDASPSEKETNILTNGPCALETSPTNDTVEPNTEKTDGNNFNNSISAKSSFESSSDDSSDSVSPEVPSTNPSKDDQTVSASTVIISSKDERVPI